MTRKCCPTKDQLVADDNIRRVVCARQASITISYDEREKRDIDDIYIMRVEQLIRCPLKALVQELGRFKNAEVVWCQEEPRNGRVALHRALSGVVLNQIHAPNRRPRYAGRARRADGTRPPV